MRSEKSEAGRFKPLCLAFGPPGQDSHPVEILRLEDTWLFNRKLGIAVTSAL